MVRIAKCKVDKIVRDALEVAFPLSGKFGDGDEATSRESDVITHVMKVSLMSVMISSVFLGRLS